MWPFVVCVHGKEWEVMEPLLRAKGGGGREQGGQFLSGFALWVKHDAEQQPGSVLHLTLVSAL